MLSGCGAEEMSESYVEEDFSYTYEEEPVEEEPAETEAPLPPPVDIEADFDVSVNPNNSFTIYTNLPDETELMLKLQGRGYLAQDSTVVKDGKAISNCFTDHGNAIRGEFTLQVTMPIPSVQTDYVRHFIGEDGEYLQGPYIKPALTSVIVEKEFKVTLPVSGTDDSEAATSEERVFNTDDSTSKSQAGETYSKGDGEVWIPTKGGKRYNNNPSCSQMENPDYVSLERAKSLGFTACGRCW